jgi:hypothetical protein
MAINMLCSDACKEDKERDLSAGAGKSGHRAPTLGKRSVVVVVVVVDTHGGRVIVVD